MKIKDPARRRFMKRSLAVLSAAPLVPFSAYVAVPRPASAADLQPIDLDLPNAKMLGYVHDASEVDTEKFPKRATEEGKKQFCSNCQLLTEGGIKLDDHEGTWGKCALFPTGLVKEEGWCNSWVPKVG